MTYYDKHGEFFGRVTECGVRVFMADGSAATRMDCNIYPVGAELSVRYEHPDGITISNADAEIIGLDIE